MIHEELILKKFYIEAKQESKLSWIKYLNTLNENQQIECIIVCQTDFEKYDWLEIFNLTIFDKLCIEYPHFNIYKFLINENMTLIDMNMMLQDQLYSMKQQLNHNFKELNYFCEAINANMKENQFKPNIYLID